MKKFPTKVKFKKPHKIKIIKGNKGINLIKFTAGIRLTHTKYISYDQIEAVRRALTRRVKPRELKRRKDIFLRKKALALAQQKLAGRSSKKKRKKRSKKKGELVFIRANFCLPLTKKPLQVRMGKGKGSVDHWVYPAKSSRVLFEMSRRRFKLRKIYRLLSLSHLKLSSKIKFIYQRKFLRREANFTISEPKCY